MSEKVEFKGDVAQAVMGDVIEAPRLNNVVTLHLGEPEKEAELITDYQRKRINMLVKEFAALSGDGDLDIYKIFITDYGLKRFRELPRAKYHEVKATLEKWIADANDAANASTPATIPAASAQATAPVPQQAMPCLACAEKKESYARLQRSARVQMIALVVCVGLCGWLLYKVPMAADAMSGPIENKCYIDGKAHSIGSTARTSAGITSECINAGDSGSAIWSNLKRPR